MPTYQFEAMDQTGQEIKDVVEAPSQDEAQATIRQMGYFVTKISVKKARKSAEKKAAKTRQDLCHRRRQAEGPHHFYPAAFHFAGRGTAHLAEPEDSRRAIEARRPEKRPDRRLRRNRGRGHPLRRHV